jgi:hypothetical protein
MEAAAAFALAQGVGTVLSTVSGIFQASSQASQDKELAKQHMAQAQADAAEGERQDLKTAAKIEAGGAAAGLLGTGTIEEILKEAYRVTGLNKARKLKQGEYDAAFYKTRAKRTKAQIPGLIFKGATELAGPGMKLYDQFYPKAP